MAVKICKKKFPLTNQSKLLLTIDWLTLNVEDNFKLLVNADKTFSLGSLMIERVDKATAHFKQMLYLWHNGSRIAVVTFDSRSPLILKGRAHIKFENHLFYNGEIQSAVELVVKEFELRSIKVSRVDIACDGVFFHEFITKYEITKYKARSNGKPHKMGLFRVNDLDNLRPVGVGFDGIALGIIDSFTVGQTGSRDSGKGKSYRFARYYNKTKELRDLNHKPYINEYFKENDFIGEVYRFEIEMRSEFISEVADFNYTHLFCIDALTALFRTGTSQFFEYRISDDTNVSRCTPVEMFAGMERGSYVRARRELKCTVRPIKQMIKRLIVDSIEMISRPKNAGVVIANQYIASIKQLLNEYSLKEWLQMKWEYFMDDVKARMNLITQGTWQIPHGAQLKMMYGAY